MPSQQLSGAKGACATLTVDPLPDRPDWTPVPLPRVPFVTPLTETPARLSRQALYELVWTEPMSVLAPRLGISDVGLAKICRRFNVPRPGRG